MPAVVQQLNQLRAQAAHAEVSEGRHIHPRNSVLDLVVVASSNEDAERAAAVAAELAAHHPCRAIILQDEPAGPRNRIDATVTSRSHELLSGNICQYEEVFLRVRGPVANHIPSLVEPMLAPDVDTYLWWTGSPPLSADRFRQSLTIGNVVIVDSNAFSRPRSLFLELAAQASSRDAPVFADFNWARVHGWREVLAQFFNPRDRRSFLTGIRRVEIEYVGEGRGNRSAANLLGAWLAARLGWDVQAASGDRGTVRFRSSRGGSVDVEQRPVRQPRLEEGEIVSVEIVASTKGADCTLRARRDPKNPAQLVLAGELWGRPLAPRVIPQESPSEAALLSHLLMDSRGDAVYPRVLELAAHVLTAGGG
ncbi:MAG: glucose-6-phosphate dehydrogenase assembly protein OpcA [Candidatus Dormibacteraeota bacterium]|nr:glucose-6-phosphate dehydrogenase assembly protein OpcA [Candidatus Dormibacteraeota bacterium]